MHQTRSRGKVVVAGSSSRISIVLVVVVEVVVVVEEIADEPDKEWGKGSISR